MEKMLSAVLAALSVAGASAARADVLDFVDPFIGTGGSGHTTPAAAYPFGMVQPGPDTGLEGWERCSGYQYGDDSIERFSQTHLSGTGCSDFSDVGFMPFAGDIDDAAAQGFCYGFDKAAEKATPGYYGVELESGVKVEATCSEHVALYRITFGKGPARLLYDPSWAHGSVAAADIRPMKDRRVSGHVGDRRGWPDRDYYFAWEVSEEPSSEKIVEYVGEDKVAKTVYLFDNLEPGGVLYLKVSLSRTSEEGARRNIDSEVPGWDFDGVHSLAREKWRSILSRVEAKGTEDRLKTLYTSIYHLCFQPNRLSDAGEKPVYSTFSCWDTYRAAGPLYTILTPEYVPAFVDSMLWHFDRNGFLPVWALWGRDNQCMIGVHSVPMIVDAFLKGFEGDWFRAWYCVKTTLAKNRRRGIARYGLIGKYGYYPCDIVEDESVSRLLEDCYDQSCAARFAKAVKLEGDFEFFRDRSLNWTNVFDSATGFMRGKDSKGAWREPFDPYKISHTTHCDYTEGNAFHWNWHVMQDPERLVQMLGGREKALARLESLFAEDSAKGSGAIPDVTGLIGQYCHGNEPSHHVIYFFSLLGRRDLAAKYIKEVMETQYGVEPDGLCGNDDCGQMSAWAIFACLGFYPFDPCGGEYVLGQAQLPEIKLTLPGGKVFTAKVAPAQDGAPDAVLFDGKPLDGCKIRHEDIMRGGELTFPAFKAPAGNPGLDDIGAGAPAGFTLDFGAAQARAAERGVPVLVLFTGSDWCVWCAKLEQEVLSAPGFLPAATSRYELVYCDFPARKEQPDSIVRRNARLRKKYGVDSFPTVAALDADGRLMTKLGYKAGGAAKWLEYAQKAIAASGDEARWLKPFDDEFVKLDEETYAVFQKAREAIKDIEDPARRKAVYEPMFAPCVARMSDFVSRLEAAEMPGTLAEKKADLLEAARHVINALQNEP